MPQLVAGPSKELWTFKEEETMLCKWPVGINCVKEEIATVS